MKVCVCVKEVPPPSVSLRLDPESGRLARGKGRINGPDQHALEEALRLRDESGAGEVVAVSMAPQHAAGALRHGLAMGVDRAVLVSDDQLSGSDALVTSKVLARALEREAPDVVLFGWVSTDAGGAMLWAAVAEHLGLPVLSRVWELHVESGRARARRQMEYGFDLAEAPLPCVVAISGAINAPRNPTLEGLVASKQKPVEELTAAELGLGPEELREAGSRTRVLSVGRPAPRAPGMLIEHGERAAEQLMRLLTAKGFV